VYPDEVPGHSELGGYQLPVAMDIFRGTLSARVFAEAKAIAPNRPLGLQVRAGRQRITFFLPGHKIMIQVQSAWFPLYDRNPQTFVPNILFCQAGGLP